MPPDVPTIAKGGLPGFEVSGWFGLAAPAGTRAKPSPC
ncbi:MAG TPA: tripartite tricarboxylate transporter substrate-binding protein [Pseudorhodoferax sp.]|nr:tripartite tricarboxylate transporter substrate-binding protein [Pseudorhodoferax sp.]